jgi:hypothetical protein
MRNTVLAVAAASLVAVLSSCVPPPRQRARAPLPPCYQQPGFSNTTLTTVITVKPGAGKVWNFPEAPSYVSSSILSRLNSDGSSRNLRFQEASGEVPNIYINVTFNETTDGTHQDSAYAEVTGFARGHTFNESSGQAPFTSWQAAASSLSDNMYTWFANGWSLTRGCSSASTTTGRKRR